MAAETEATGADRIAEAIAADGREIVAPFLDVEDADEWAESLAGSVRHAVELRGMLREFNRDRAEALTKLRAQQKTLPSRDARRSFEALIQRIARATDLNLRGG